MAPIASRSEPPVDLTPRNDVSLAWRHLRYSTAHWVFQRKVPILRRLTGSLEYHSLQGFMGPSGCGKTTLIKCLTGNLTNGLSPETEIYLNPVEKGRPVVGLIERPVHEMIVGQLTVLEALRYAFLFKNHWSDRPMMASHIEFITNELMLDRNVLNRRFERCSGGEQKRVAIAQELMSLHHQPSLLFVDEPTTGLDSNSALVVMKCLRRLADNHRMSITVSIHTPNSDIVHLFDKLYVLAKGGVCIYSGPPNGLQQNLRQHFGLEPIVESKDAESILDEEEGVDEEIHEEEEEESSPIEEYLKIACMGIESPKVRTLADATLIAETKRLEPILDRLDFLPSGMPRHFKLFKAKDFIVEFCRLFHIMFLVNWRSVLAVLSTFIYHFLVIATVFNGPEMVRAPACCSLGGLNRTANNDLDIEGTVLTTEINLSDDCHENLRNSAHHDSFIMHQSMTTLFISSIAMGLACFLFVPIVKVFHNEHRNCWYSIATFYCSLSAIQLIESVLYVIFSTCLIYFPMDFLYLDGYRLNWRRFGHFFFFYWIEFLYMQSFGHFLLILAGDRIQIFMVLVQIFITVLFLFNGHFIILEQLGNPLAIKISTVLATRYINNGVLYSFFGLDRCDDPGTEYSIMLHKYSVDTQGLYWNLARVLVNLVIIRMLTLIFMWIRYRFRGKPPRMRKRQPTAMIPIDYDGIDRTRRVNVYRHPTKRRKPENEIKFEQFCRGRIHLAWRSLSLFGVRMIRETPSVRKVKDPKFILRNLNGYFRFGTLNAVMGTSGSGKTSLLKVLNGRWKTWLSEETKFYISKYTTTRTCFISQEISGHLLPGLTAKQSLIYAAKLKNIMEPDASKINYEEIAIKLLNELDIAHTASNFVDYCSDGERKRLALALELTSLRMPNLICIDEPTSGLDSNSSAIEIRCLRKLVRRHLITIMVSIHQPNMEILHMFDQIYCLARGGVCIYSGAPGKIADYLAQVPEIELPADLSYHPTEELMKYSCLNHDDPLVQSLRKLADTKILVESSEHIKTDLVRLPDGIQLNRPRFTVVSFCFLFYRNWMYQKNYLWLETLSYVALYIFHALLLRFLFNPRIVFTSGCLSLDEDFSNLSPQRMQDQIDLVNNSCYTILTNTLFLLIFHVQSGFAFTKEEVYFFNEHRNGWYSTMSFYLMKSLYEILSLIPVIFLYIYIVDVFEPIHPGIYWWMVLLATMGTLAFQGQSHLLALVIGQNFIVLIVISFANFFTWFVLSNCFNPIADMHYGYQFLANFSVLRYINEALFQLQYGFGRCNQGQIAAVLYKMMIPQDNGGQYFYYCLRMLAFQIVFFRVLALVVLIMKSNPVQNRLSRGSRIRKQLEEQRLPSTRSFAGVIPGLTSHQEFHIKQVEL